MFMSQNGDYDGAIAVLRNLGNTVTAQTKQKTFTKSSILLIKKSVIMCHLANMSKIITHQTARKDRVVGA